MQPVAETPVEDFETLFNGQPQDIERRLLALRPKAACHPDITLAPRIEARLALAQAMQGRHEEASHTLALAKNNSIIERGARWGIARALRALGQTTEALDMQQQVLSEYNQLEETGALPLELIQMGRGLVHEELAQLSTTAGPEHAIRALQDLKSLIGKDHPEYHDRLNKLKHLAQDHP